MIFETLQSQVPIDWIVSVNGSAKTHCVAPDHLDNDPSMHLYDDHVHCFACGFHGDVVDVWAATHSFDRPIDAALDLAREFGIELPDRHLEATGSETHAPLPWWGRVWEPPAGHEAPLLLRAIALRRTSRKNRSGLQKSRSNDSTAGFVENLAILPHNPIASVIADGPSRGSRGA